MDAGQTDGRLDNSNTLCLLLSIVGDGDIKTLLRFEILTTHI